jgi:hypothetical protein
MPPWPGRWADRCRRGSSRRRWPRPFQLRSEPDGLWVVQDHHVARADPSLQLRQRLFLGLLVEPPDGLIHAASVTWLAVQQVVEALGHLEEFLVALQHHPPGVDAGAGQVAEQEVQHLGDAAALFGRVHVPQAPASEPICRLAQPVHEATGRLRLEHAPEAARVKLWDLDFLHVCRLQRRELRTDASPCNVTAHNPQDAEGRPH